MSNSISNAYSALWFQLFMPMQKEEWTQKDVTFLARQLPKPRYQRVLDLCCGHGRHALPLARLGYTVTGLDRDEATIAQARENATEAGMEITYLVDDMQRVGAIEGEFDAVINMWQSFGYFDEETNADLLRQIANKLTPGGRLCIDMYNREYFEQHQGPSRQEIDGISVESSGYMQDNRWHSVLTYRNLQGELLSDDHMEWQLFTPSEFRKLAETCGFTMHLACTWSDEDRSPAPDIPRMQMVLEKE